jgi:predicted transcriptional regulator
MQNIIDIVKLIIFMHNNLHKYKLYYSLYKKGPQYYILKKLDPSNCIKLFMIKK